MKAAFRNSSKACSSSRRELYCPPSPSCESSQLRQLCKISFRVRMSCKKLLTRHVDPQNSRGIQLSTVVAEPELQNPEEFRPAGTASQFLSLAVGAIVHGCPCQTLRPCRTGRTLGWSILPADKPQQRTSNIFNMLQHGVFEVSHAVPIVCGVHLGFLRN